MFCSKCGKEILDEAVICCHCGCATQNYASHIEKNVNGSKNKKDPKLIEFIGSVNSAYTLSIVSLVLCLGIGLIFELINAAKISKLQKENLQLASEDDIAAYQQAKIKLGKAFTLHNISLVITGISIVILFIGLLNH